MRPTLFDAVASPHPQKPCPRCGRGVDVRLYCRKGTRANAWCPDCHVLAASETLWLECWAWCKANVGLLRQAIRSVRPDIAAVSEAWDVVSMSVASVVQAAVGHDPKRESRFSTWAAEGVKLMARKLPHGDGAKQLKDWSRIEKRAS